MNDDARNEHLRTAEHAVADLRANTKEVLAALDATFDAMPGPITIPDDPRARAAVESELAAARAELIGVHGALSALRARELEVIAPLGPSPDPREVMPHRAELSAIHQEVARQRDRVVVLEAVVDDLEDALTSGGPHSA